MEEVYKPILGFEKKYLISNYGNIKSIKTNKILKKQIINDGYLSSTLCGKPYLIHKLVIENFSNEKKINVVDHIDGNKQNNCIFNLRHTTFSENTKNAYINNPKMKKILTKVYKYDINNKLIKIYSSMAECKNDNNISNSSVIRNASNNNKLINNYYYKTEDKKNNKIKINLDDIIKIKDDEQFLKIDDFFNNNFKNYYISNYGRIYNINKQIIMKTLKKVNGYEFITMVSDDSKTFKIPIHRLVAYFFINKYENKKVINHIDENKYNNYFKNLEITTQKDNIIHSKALKINKYTLDMKLINKYNCMKDAANELKIEKYGNISKCCQGKLKSAYRFIWKYDN
jgi:hypothetical protein